LRRGRGWPGPWLLLVLVWGSACSLTRPPYPLPPVTMRPLEYTVAGEAYLCVRAKDWAAVRDHLKACCLEQGGTATVCQTEEP
jgi:hypothetical protein